MNKDDTISKTSLYFSGYTRLFTAFAVSLFLIAISKNEDFMILISKPKFYFSLVYGFFTALLLIQLIHYSNVIFDHFFPWNRWQIRLIIMVTFGIIPILFIDWYIVKVIYRFAEKDFEKSGFTKNILPINALLICFGYLCFYVLRWYKLQGNEKGISILPVETPYETVNIFPLETTIIDQPVLPSSLNDEVIEAIEMKQVSDDNPNLVTYLNYVEGYIQNKKFTIPISQVAALGVGSVYGDVYLKDGTNMVTLLRKKVLRALLDPTRFLETRGGLFVAYDIILTLGEDKAHATLILKPGFPNYFNINISKRFHGPCTSAFQAHKEKSA